MATPQTQRSFLQWLEQAIASHAPENTETPPLGYIPFVLPEIEVPVFPVKRIPGDANKGGSASGHFSYSVVEFDSQTRDQYDASLETLKTLKMMIPANCSDSVRLSYSVALWSASSFEAGYDGLDQQIAAWVWYLSGMFITETNSSGDQGLISGRGSSSSDIHHHCFILDWAAAALDSYLAAHPEAGNAHKCGQAPLVVSSPGKESALLVLLRNVGAELNKLADRKIAMEGTTVDEELLGNWYHLTHAAGVCCAILDRYKEWVSQDDLRFEINGSFLPSVWRALAALSPANMKLIRELNPGVAAAAAHAGRNLAVPGITVLLELSTNTFFVDEYRGEIDRFEAKYESKMVLDGMSTLVVLYDQWQRWQWTVHDDGTVQSTDGKKPPPPPVLWAEGLSSEQDVYTANAPFVYEHLLSHILEIINRTDGAYTKFAKSDLADTLYDALQFVQDNSERFKQARVDGKGPYPDFGVYDVGQIMCLVCARDNSPSRQYATKLRNQPGALDRLFDLMAWCCSGPEFAFLGPSRGTQEYLGFEMMCCLVAEICWENPEGSEMAILRGADLLINVASQAIPETRPMKGQELAADGVLRAALGCIVIMINAGHELYAPGYEERAELVAASMQLTTDKGLSPRLLSYWLSLVSTEYALDEYAGWVLPIPSRVSLIFLIDIYIVRTTQLRDACLVSKVYRDVTEGLLSAAEKDLKTIKLLTSGKKAFDSDGNKRVGLLQAGQTLLGWLHLVLAVAKEKKGYFCNYPYLYDYIAGSMLCAAQMSADWLVTHHNSELPSAMSMIPGVAMELEDYDRNLCYCCWAGTKLEDLLDKILFPGLELFERLLGTQEKDKVMERKEVLLNIGKTLRRGEKKLEKHLKEMKVEIEKISKMKKAYWPGVPERVDALVAAVVHQNTLAQAAADAAMAALLAEEEGIARADQEAEEKKRLKRQRQKEKQRAAKEAAEAEEKAKREAAEAEERKKAQEEEREKVETAEKEAAARAIEEAKKLQGIDAQLASEQGPEGVDAQTEDAGDKSGPSEGFGNIDGGASSSEPPAAPKSAKKAAKKKKKKKAKEEAEEGSRPGSDDATGVPNSPSTEAAIDTSPGGVGTPEVREAEAISASIVSDAMLFGDLGISENYGAEEPHDQVAGSLSKSVEGASIADVEIALAHEDSGGGNADLAGLMETPELYAAPVPSSMPLETSKKESSAAPPSETNDWKQLLSFLLPDAEIIDSQATPAIEEEEHETLAAQDHGHDRALDDFPDTGVSTRSTAGGVLVPPPPLRPRALPPHTLLAVCIAQPARWARLEAALRCPFSEAPLYDPVILPDGITYDRTAAKSLGQMEVRGARPNRSMQQLLRELCGA